MSFLKKIVDRMIGTDSEGYPKKPMTEAEILKAIDELAEEEVKKIEEEKKTENLIKVPAAKLWSSFKYLSNVGNDENGDYNLFFVVPFGLDKEEKSSIVTYLCFPLNGSYLDIVERSVKI
jgi:hypothetical protein